MTDCIYYVCKYTPLELLAGCGAKLKLLEPETESFECAEACAHPNLCGYGKGVLEEIERRAGSADAIRALILTDCCDVMRRVYDVLAEKKTVPFLYFLPLPHTDNPAGIRLFAGELSKCLTAWEDFSGTHFHSARAEEATAQMHVEGVYRSQANGSYLSVEGAHVSNRLIGTMEESFSIPLVNHSCTGGRVLAHGGGNFGEKNDAEPLFSYAKALLLQQSPCMRMQFKTETKKDPACEAVIYHTIKFCDYYGFDYARRREGLAIPILKIETDQTAGSSGQLSTRIEALAETVHRGRKKEGKKKMSGKNIRYAAGVDSGSTSTDAVIMDQNRSIVASVILPTGSGAKKGAEEALSQALAQANLTQEDLDAIVTTGYGRDNIRLSGDSVTEISCHARGAHYLYPQARTVIDIGGQDSKVIRIDAEGNVKNFVMNDKCAAGTGRFLELMAKTLGISLEEMSRKGLAYTDEVSISSMCTVFAESEVVSLIADNTVPENIIHGLNLSVARKTVGLIKRIGGEEPYMITGGVAQNEGLVQTLEDKLGSSVFVSDRAQVCGAIGACLYAFDA